jgi:cell division transport system ATP-binding protein
LALLKIKSLKIHWKLEIGKLPSEARSMFSLYNVTKKYLENVIALSNVCFKIEEKEFVVVAGRSGAGKTTLLRLLTGEEKPTSGQIFFEGRDITKLKPKSLPYLRQRVATIFQDYKLLPSRTIWENLCYVMEITGCLQKHILRDVSEVLEIVNLSDRADDFPSRLSGGEMQRLAIGRALLVRPEIILADEPTGNLDPYNSRDVIQLLLKINEIGTTIILATHDKPLINSLQKRVITLEEGKVISDENPGRFNL